MPGPDPNPPPQPTAADLAAAAAAAKAKAAEPSAQYVTTARFDALIALLEKHGIRAEK
jgi:hypothetical protein